MHFKKVIVLAVLIFLVFSVAVHAGTVTESDAIAVANNWLAMNGSPMGESMGNLSLPR